MSTIVDIIEHMRYEKTEKVIEEGRKRARKERDFALAALVEFLRHEDAVAVLRRIDGLNVEARERAFFESSQRHAQKQLLEV